MRHRKLALIALLLGAAPVGVLDDMDAVAGWQAMASDGVSATAAAVNGHHGKALRLEWDFRNVAGYAYVRRALPLTLPENYAISVWVRWTGGVNNLEFKLVDASGDNVWWVTRPDIQLKPGWQKLTFRKRDIHFAWGPTNNRVLHKAASIQFVISRGRDGGKGNLDLDDLELAELTSIAAALPAPVLSAPEGKAALAMDGTDSPWRGRGPLTVDFGGAREFGGLTIRWLTPPPPYTVQTSVDGKSWDRRRRITDSDGGNDPIALPETEARYLRIVPDSVAALSEIAVEPLDWAATPNAFIAALAKVATRGTYPRAFSNEQNYWTLVGTDGGAASGLIGEDGAVEVARGGFSVEPFVEVGAKRFGWANVKAAQSLADGYLPIPSVLLTGPGWTLETRAFADQSVAKGRLMLRYTLRNTGKRPLAAQLQLGVRPFQVNPPAQFLSQQGGVSAINELNWTGRELTVLGADRTTSVVPLEKPDSVIVATFDSGGALERARHRNMPLQTHIRDETGLASAALTYRLVVPPRGSRTVRIVVPFPGAPAAFVDATTFARAEQATAGFWREKLNQVDISVPPGKQAMADTVRTSLAHILMSRDGPILRPGTRSYARSWIRDGAMISEGLLRLGRSDTVSAYADWYAPFAFPNGKIPCCVDFKGADPVPENDSQGEFIFLAAQLYRYTGDRAALARRWPTIAGAEHYMETLRATTRVNRTEPWLFGLMPPSISHEGYSAKPQFSLWDDFWALRGYKDAAFAAVVLGKSDAAAIAGHRDEFQRDLLAATRSSAEHWVIDFIPGATSLGDFDATSTTVALDPGGEQARLDPAMLRATFDRYWLEFVARRDGLKQWKDYTPYEMRVISAMIRLGHRERVDPLLAFFFSDRRPQAWNGWAEVVGKDAREVRFIGDMPHAWVSSDFIRAALDMFAYDRPDDAALVLGAGLSDAYLSGPGSSIRGLHTPYGTLDVSFRASPKILSVAIGGTAQPPRGYVLPWPWKTPPGTAMIDGTPARFKDGMLVIPAHGHPIRVEVSR